MFAKRVSSSAVWTKHVIAIVALVIIGLNHIIASHIHVPVYTGYCRTVESCDIIPHHDLRSFENLTKLVATIIFSMSIWAMKKALAITSATMQSPLGPIYLVATSKGLTCCTFESLFKATEEKPEGDFSKKGHEILQQAETELHEYFQESRTEFTVQVAAEGPAFQTSVWKALQDIPYGTTASYSDIANAIGNPKAVRAVGMANNRNPISLIIPCHRVIGKDGSMVGYGGGLDRKKELLKLEAANDEKQE